MSRRLARRVAILALLLAVPRPALAVHHPGDAGRLSSATHPVERGTA